MEYITEFLENAGGIARDTGEALIAVILVILVYIGCRHGLTTLSKNGKLGPAVGLVVRKLLRWLAFVIAVMLVLQSYGVLQNAWAAITTILGLVAIGFVAVWSVLSNTLCSLVILLLRPFEVGDEVELPTDGIAGRVVNFNMVFTRLATDDGAFVQVPNNLFFQKPLKRRPGKADVTLDEQLTIEKDARPLDLPADVAPPAADNDAEAGKLAATAADA